MTLGDLLLGMCDVCCCTGKMYADGKPAHCRMRILTDSARNRNTKEVLANVIKQEVT